MIELHANAKVTRSTKDYVCSKCGKNIKSGELYIRINPKYINPFWTCLDCAPSKKQINEMIVEERKEYYSLMGDEEDGLDF